MALNQLLAQGLTTRYSRRTVLKGSVALGAGAAALSFLGGPVFHAGAGAEAAPLDNDLAILNYALTLEYLEAAAYKAVNDAGVLSGRAATYFKAFGQHEAEHVAALLATIPKLGGTPVALPAFNFTGVPNNPAEIVKFFQMVEEIGVSAYLGAAGSIKNVDVLEAALSIHAVEAEHASVLADLVAPGSNLFAPDAFQKARTPDEVLQIVAPFLAAQMPGLPSTGGGWAAGGGDLVNREMSRNR
jgi:hypothetical protein